MRSFLPAALLFVASLPMFAQTPAKRSMTFADLAAMALGPARNAEGANCNALKDSVAADDPVETQVLDYLLYRHWNTFVGPKHSHIFYGCDRWTRTNAYAEKQEVGDWKQEVAKTRVDGVRTVDADARAGR